MTDIRMDHCSLAFPGQTVNIKSWYCEKEGIPATLDAVITGESEKAFFMYFENGQKFCVPKSLCEAM